MKYLLAYRKVILFLMVLASALLAPGLAELRISHNMDDYFSASGDELSIYLKYREIFGHDDQFLLVSFRSDSSIYEKNFLDKLKEVKEGLRMLEEVEEVFWIDDWTPAGLRVRKRFVEKIEGRNLFVSEDHRLASFLILHKEFIEKEAMDDFLREIKEQLKSFPPEQIRLAGKVYLTRSLEEFMKENSGFLFLLCFLLILLILYAILGSIRILLLSLSVPFFSILFTMGLMGKLGFHINLFTTLIPTLILIISVSDIIHIVKGAGPWDSLGRVKYHFPALLLTSITTAIGFGSLITTEISSIMEFGGFVAVGVMYTFCFSLLLFSGISPEKYKSRKAVDRLLEKMHSWIQENYQNKWILWGIISCFILITISGISKLRKNSYMIQGVSIDSSIRQEALHFDQNFAGIRPLSILIENTGSEELPAPMVLQKLDSLIKSYMGTRFLVGPKRGEDAYLKLMSEDGKYFRFYGLMRDIGSKEAVERYDKLKQILSSNPLFDKLHIRQTGQARMMDKNTDDITRSIALGLCTALSITFILLAIYFKALPEAAISILVNTIPLLILASVYGLMGIELRAGTSIVFTIAFGIAIDDTMHILASYQKHKSSSSSFDPVIRDAAKPILMTSLVFGLSFSVLIFSGLEAVSVLGLSMVIGCFFAFLSDIFILPALLAMIRKKSLNFHEKES